jgi:ATP-utilizing enzymes of the PP-loop superfamily
MEFQDVLKKLRCHIEKMRSLAVAYSGGVDSTFLLKVAHDVLRDQVIAVTARSSTYPERELNDAAEFTRSAGIKHIIIQSEELDIEGFTNNPPNPMLFVQIRIIFQNKRSGWETPYQIHCRRIKHRRSW